MSRNLIYISYKLDSRVSHYAGTVLDCLLTFGDQTLDSVINIYPCNQTLASRLKLSLSTIKRAKNDLENLGLIIRYYDETKHKDMIKIPFSALDEYMIDKSVTINGSIRAELVDKGGSIRPSSGSIGTTTLHRPFLYNNNKSKKETELTNASSPSFTPVENVRSGSLCNPHHVRSDEEKATAIYWLEQMRVKKNSG